MHFLKGKRMNFAFFQSLQKCFLKNIQLEDDEKICLSFKFLTVEKTEFQIPLNSTKWLGITSLECMDFGLFHKRWLFLD